MRLSIPPVAMVAWLGAALLLAGCASGGGSGGRGTSGAPSAVGTAFVLHVLNIDGPTVGLMVGEQVVATVPCGSGVDLHAGAGDVPALPWTLEVRTAAGALVGSASYPTGAAEQSLQIRGGKVTTGGIMSGGPSAGPDACASARASPAHS